MFHCFEIVHFIRILESNYKLMAHKYKVVSLDRIPHFHYVATRHESLINILHFYYILGPLTRPAEAISASAEQLIN